MKVQFKVSIVGDKKSCEMYRQDCELTMRALTLDVINIEALEEEIDTLEDGGFDDECEENDFSSDWKYYYLVLIKTNLNIEEVKDYLNDKLLYYDLESEIIEVL